MVSHNHNVAAKDSFLKNTYLMAMTVSHLQEYGEKWCLLNVALTSKDFLDVALDELWEDMDSFLPLLELLPALQVKDDEYVCANVHAFRYHLQVMSSLVPCRECFKGRLG